MHLQRAAHGLGRGFQFLARAPATQVGDDHFLHVVAGEGFFGLADGVVGLPGDGFGAVSGRLGGWALLQLLDALSEPNKAEIVKRRGLELLVLTGEGAFQGGLRFAEFARAKLARAGIVEFARGGRRRLLRSGGGGGGAEGGQGDQEGEEGNPKSEVRGPKSKKRM